MSARTPKHIRHRVQVAIVGGGPAGLLLGQLLARAGIEAWIIERQSAAHVQGRIRAGVLEQTTVDLLSEAGVGDRMHREGQVHRGFELLVRGQRHRIDLTQLTNGRQVVVYGQTEVTRDLMQARSAAGLSTVYEADEVQVQGFDGDSPQVSYRHHGHVHTVHCDFVAGCDGFHGVCRTSVPTSARREYEKVYPFGWLGVLSDTQPVSNELVYGSTERGFILCSQRSAMRSRYYLQVPLTDRADQWGDDAFWAELKQRLDAPARAGLQTGPSIEKSIAPLRSFVTEPLRFGRLFLAGDAGHIVPPTGAKGLNLAASDVRFLSQALIEHYREGSNAGVDHYSARALARVWKAERFSWWFTHLMHHFPEENAFNARLREAELDYLLGSEAAQRVMAENYVGLQT